MVAERVFAAQRLALFNVACDEEVGVGQNHFQSGQDAYQALANSAKQIKVWASGRNAVRRQVPGEPNQIAKNRLAESSVPGSIRFVQIIF